MIRRCIRGGTVDIRLLLLVIGQLERGGGIVVVCDTHRYLPSTQVLSSQLMLEVTYILVPT